MPGWGSRTRRGASGRLPRPLYDLATRLVPIACIDVLPYRRDSGTVEIGLIQRRDPERVLVWSLVGGGIHRGESLGEAAARHILGTLGPGVTWEDPNYAYPATVGEYFPQPHPGAAHDPRKHAIALTYPIALRGEILPRGEALGFSWFAPTDLPLEQMGFGQEKVVRNLQTSGPLGGPPDRRP